MLISGIINAAQGRWCSFLAWVPCPAPVRIQLLTPVWAPRLRGWGGSFPRKVKILGPGWGRKHVNQSQEPSLSEASGTRHSDVIFFCLFRSLHTGQVLSTPHFSNCPRTSIKEECISQLQILKWWFWFCLDQEPIYIENTTDQHGSEGALLQN